MPQGLCGLCQVGVAMRRLCAHGQELAETPSAVGEKSGLEQLQMVVSCGWCSDWEAGMWRRPGRRSDPGQSHRSSLFSLSAELVIGIEPEQTPLGSHLWSPPCTSCIHGHLPLHHHLGLVPGLGTSSHSGAQITASFPFWRRAFHMPCLHTPCSPGPSHDWHMALSSVG